MFNWFIFCRVLRDEKREGGGGGKGEGRERGREGGTKGKTDRRGRGVVEKEKESARDLIKPIVNGCYHMYTCMYIP